MSALSEPQQQSLIDAPCIRRAPYQGTTVTTRESSRSGSDRVTPTHQGKAAQLLEFFQRGPATLNEAAEYFKWPLSSVCSLKWAIEESLEEVDTVLVRWPTGKTTQRTRWRVKP